MNVHEFIVLGSGCSGAMAAQTLIEKGAEVMMLDVGNDDTHYEQLIPDKDFGTIRKTEQDQFRYFIGDDAEGVAWGKVGKGEQVTPPRKHMLKRVDELLPLASDTFNPLESLGYGGLGIGWGIGCWEFSARELRAASLSVNKMGHAYNVVSRRIGISATKDKAASYTLGGLTHFQPSADIDRNHRQILERYQRRYEKLYTQGFIMGRAPLALLTQPLDNRNPYQYRDMDFYSDRDKSAWRPRITIDALRLHKNFTYTPGQLMLRFEEKSTYILVKTIDTTQGTIRNFRCKRLVLCSGALSTARIVLRSVGQPGSQLPLLCNPYSYIPCLQPRTLGKELERHKLGFAQLSLFYDPDHDLFDTSMASLYSYQSLMLFRMIRQLPLNFADGRIINRYISSAMVIMGLHQPDSPSADKYVELNPNMVSPTGDILSAHYASTPIEQHMRSKREALYMKTARKLGLIPLKKIDPGFGSSVHYAGTVPFSDTDKPFSIAPSGRLHGTRSIYIADSSGFTYLPAKGLTFSLMANAHIVAGNALHGA